MVVTVIVVVCCHPFVVVFCFPSSSHLDVIVAIGAVAFDVVFVVASLPSVVNADCGVGSVDGSS